jgi:hypothetical protein
LHKFVALFSGGSKTQSLRVVGFGLDTRLQALDQGCADLIGIGHHGDVCHFHHGGIGVFVHCDDKVGIGCSGSVLDGAADAKGKKNSGFDMFTGLADQGAVIGPSGIYDGAGGADLTRE